MRVRKVRVGLLERRDDAPWWALAWTDRAGTVWYRRPGRRRFAHEAAHNLRQADNAQLHHSAGHCCVLVGHAVRLHDGCATDRELAGGETLLRAQDGVWVEV